MKVRMDSSGAVECEHVVWRPVRRAASCHGIDTLALIDPGLAMTPLSLNLPGPWGVPLYPGGMVTFVESNSLEPVNEDHVARTWAEACKRELCPKTAHRIADVSRSQTVSPTLLAMSIPMESVIGPIDSNEVSEDDEEDMNSKSSDDEEDPWE